MKIVTTLAVAAAGLGALAAAPAVSSAQEVKWVRSIPYSLALEAAQAAMACSERLGSHTSVGVMDFTGGWKVLLVPDNATLIGQKVLPEKMNAALLRQGKTKDMVALSKPPARAEIDTSGNVLERIAPGMAVVSPGAVPLFAGKDFVGVIGVGGATTPGDVDNVCAQAGADKIADRLK